MSLRLTAERVDHQLRDYMRPPGSPVHGNPDSALSSVLAQALTGFCAPLGTKALIHHERIVGGRLRRDFRLVTRERQRAIVEENCSCPQVRGGDYTTSDENVADALIRVAREQNATQILVGKSKRGLFSRSQRLIEDLVEKSHNVDVYIVGQEDTTQQERKRRAIPKLQSTITQYILASAIVAFVALCCFPFAQLIGYRTVSMSSCSPFPFSLYGSARVRAHSRRDGSVGVGLFFHPADLYVFHRTSKMS